MSNNVKCAFKVLRLDCQHQLIAYNSCRNRHCPKCQNGERAQWLENHSAELLPVEYFHVVFTVPEPVARIALFNPQVVYGILFATASQTLLTFAADPKHLGASLSRRWNKRSRNKNSAYRRNWRRSRTPMLSRHSVAPNRRSIIWGAAPLAQELESAYRVAISNERLLSDANGQVTFLWKDYRHKDKQKSRPMTLSGDEFMRRFLLHTLPAGFQGIRHFGFLANRHRKDKLALCRKLLANPITELLPQPDQCRQLLPAVAEPQPKLCLNCGTGVMIRRGIIPGFRWPAVAPDSS